jgi:hypothetical protein
MEPFSISDVVQMMVKANKFPKYPPEGHTKYGLSKEREKNQYAPRVCGRELCCLKLKIVKNSTEHKLCCVFQSDIVHQSVYELVHSEDREELQRQLLWNSFLPADLTGMPLSEALAPDKANLLERSFTVRFRCLLDNTSGFLVSTL